MHRVLSLPNLARSTDRHIEAASDFAHPPDYDEYFEARHEGYAKLGAEALAASAALRQRYLIDTKGRAQLGSDWSPEVFLNDRIDEFNKRREALRND